MTRSYYRGAAGALIVYDITNRVDLRAALGRHMLRRILQPPGELVGRREEMLEV